MGSSISFDLERSVRSLDERLGPRDVPICASVAVVCGIGVLSNPSSTTSIGNVIGSISTEGSITGICVPRPCAPSGRKPSATFPDVVTTVKTDLCMSAVQAMVALLGSVMFWDVNLFRDATRGGFKAVQGVLPGLL